MAILSLKIQDNTITRILQAHTRFHLLSLASVSLYRMITTPMPGCSSRPAASYAGSGAVPLPLYPHHAYRGVVSSFQQQPVPSPPSEKIKKINNPLPTFELQRRWVHWLRTACSEPHGEPGAACSSPLVHAGDGFPPGGTTRRFSPLKSSHIKREN